MIGEGFANDAADWIGGKGLPWFASHEQTWRRAVQIDNPAYRRGARSDTQAHVRDDDFGAAKASLPDGFVLDVCQADRMGTGGFHQLLKVVGDEPFVFDDQDMTHVAECLFEPICPLADDYTGSQSN